MLKMLNASVVDADVKLLRRHLNTLLSLYPTSTTYFIHSFRGYWFSTTKRIVKSFRSLSDNLRLTSILPGRGLTTRCRRLARCYAHSVSWGVYSRPFQWYDHFDCTRVRNLCPFEGGMFQFMSLRNLLAKSDFTGVPSWSAVPSVLVMDSVPGDDGVHQAVTSAALPVPNPVKRAIFIPTAVAA